VATLTTSKASATNDFMSQEELDSLLKGVTGETCEPDSEEIERTAEVWAAKMADAETRMTRLSPFEFDLMEEIIPKPITLARLIEKLEYEIERADRDISLILERRNVTAEILEDLHRIAE